MVVGRVAAAVHAGDHEEGRVGLGEGFPADGGPLFIGLHDVVQAQGFQHELGDTFVAGDVRVAGHLGAGEPDQRTGLLEAFALRGGDGVGQARLELVVQLLAAILYIEDLGQLADAFVNCVDAERLQPRAVGTHQVVLAFAVGGQQVGGNLQLVELLAGANHALRADHPFQLGGHQLRALGDHGFEAWLVIGQALDGVVLRLERGQYAVEPQRGADHRVGHAQRVEHFRGRLADGHAARRCLREGQRATAVLHRQRVMSGGRVGQGAEAQAGEQGGDAWQHGAISVWTVRGTGAVRFGNTPSKAAVQAGEDVLPGHPAG